LVAADAAWTDGKVFAALAETLHKSNAAASVLKHAEVTEMTGEAKGSRMWLTLLALWALSVHDKVLLC
jgi:hypothetical protein